MAHLAKTEAEESRVDLLALGAREAVEHIRNGDITAESYVAQLLAQYDAHRDLNVATAIEPAGVLEAARAVDGSLPHQWINMARHSLLGSACQAAICPWYFQTLEHLINPP